MPPKYGLMKYVLDAAHATGTGDVHFVPFVTSFDLIRDVEEYAAEQTGRSKKPESLSWFLGYMKSLRAPSGRILFDNGQPGVHHRERKSDHKGEGESVWVDIGGCV